METETKNIERDIENILTNVAQSANIKNYKVFSNHTSTQGDGFLSDFFTGEVLNKDNGKYVQVAIKKAPLDSSTGGLLNTDIYKNEINFYSKVFPLLDKFQKEKNVKCSFDHIPRYFVGNTDSTNVYVAMENLKTEGYVLFDKKKFFDSEHLERVFKIYGKFHALSFTFKQKYDKEYKNLVENITFSWAKLMGTKKVIPMLKNAYVNALDSFDPETESDILAKLKTIENVEDTINNISTYKGRYECIVHGDCWSNNMLFKYKESGELEDIKLIDFQLVNPNTPINDLSYFFYSGASKKDMDKLDYYLDVYYKSFSHFATELGENPEEIFPLEVLKKEWKEYAVFGIFFGCFVWVIKLLDREEIATVLTQRGLPGNKFNELLQEKIASILKGAEFREKARDICLHAVECGIV